jgi:hypothetical protein
MQSFVDSEKYVAAALKIDSNRETVQEYIKPFTATQLRSDCGLPCGNPEFWGYLRPQNRVDTSDEEPDDEDELNDADDDEWIGSSDSELSGEESEYRRDYVDD